MPKSILFVLFLLASAAVSAGETRHFGLALPAGPAESIANAEAGAADAPPRKFSGRIVEVCQKKGCWAMLEDGGVAARVMMMDYAFLLPKDAAGLAVVYGTLVDTQLDPGTARHLAEDAGRDAASVPARELRIQALGLELSDG